MKTLLTISSIALIVSSSFAMAGNGQGKGNFTSLDVNNDGAITVEEARGRIAKNFTSIDSNNDGQITTAELQQTSKGKQGNKQGKGNNKKQGKSYNQSANRFATLDLNNDGSISEQEFTKVTSERQVERIKQIASRPTFSELDKNGDNQLSKEERQAMSTYQGNQNRKGGNKAKGNANKLSGKADSNQDGLVSAEEFAAMQEKQSIKRAERMQNRPTFAELDSDGNGKISQTEHKAFSQKRSAEKRALKQQS